MTDCEVKIEVYLLHIPPVNWTGNDRKPGQGEKAESSKVYLLVE